LDTFQFNLITSANKTVAEQQVFLNEEACAFIASDPFYTYLSIFKKVKNGWKQLFVQSFPVATNRSFGSYYASRKVLKTITLLDPYKAQVEFTNSSIEIHTYDPKTNKFEVETIKNEEKK
jgi:hypothetical protein